MRDCIAVSSTSALPRLWLTRSNLIGYTTATDWTMVHLLIARGTKDHYAVAVQRA